MAMAVASPSPPAAPFPFDDHARDLQSFPVDDHQSNIMDLDFQDVHRLLSLETSNDNLLHGTNHSFATYSKRKDGKVEKEGQKTSDKPHLLTLRECSDGKENAISGKLSRRRGSLRREGSHRITSHHPFKVDLRSFGSMSEGMLGDLQIPRDVHAFWESEDEREASEAIMRKIRGEDEPCSQQSVSGNSRSRRQCARRAGSQRRTKSRRITLELPSYVKQMQSLDEEQLEEEEDTNVESCTFVKSSEFREKRGHDMPCPESQHIHSELSHSNSLRSDNLQQEGTDKVLDHVDNTPDMVIAMTEGGSPVSSTKENGQRICNEIDMIASNSGPSGDLKVLQGSDNVDTVKDHVLVSVDSSAADEKAGHTRDTAEVDPEGSTKCTPYDKNAALKRTPFTSPTTPSNPLAAPSSERDVIMEGIGKRKLNFDNTMGCAVLEPLAASTASIKNVSPCLQKSSASQVSPVKTVQGKNPLLKEETNSVSFNEALKDQNTQSRKLQSKKGLRRTKVMETRNSLAGSGTVWKNGARCSTRIRSRPLEFWRGEKFLYGRIHQSLTTVIGIKYSSPPPRRPNRRAALGAKFKVESFVSEKYADYVRFAAL